MKQEKKDGFNEITKVDFLEFHNEKFNFANVDFGLKILIDKNGVYASGGIAGAYRNERIKSKGVLKLISLGSFSLDLEITEYEQKEEFLRICFQGVQCFYAGNGHIRCFWTPKNCIVIPPLLSNDFFGSDLTSEQQLQQLVQLSTFSHHKSGCNCG